MKFGAYNVLRHRLCHGEVGIEKAVSYQQPTCQLVLWNSVTYVTSRELYHRYNEPDPELEDGATKPRINQFTRQQCFLAAQIRAASIYLRNFVCAIIWAKDELFHFLSVRHIFPVKNYPSPGADCTY